MAHIIDFHVEGLTGRKHAFGHSLNRDINVFFGLNGSGKTSLLKIFHSAFLKDASSIENVAYRKAEVTIETITYKTAFHYSITHPKSLPIIDQPSLLEAGTDQTEESRAQAQYRRMLARRRRSSPEWNVEPDLPTGVAHWHHRYLPTSRLVSGITEDQSQPVDEDFYDKMFANELKRHWIEFFGNVQAEVRAIQQEGIANILSELLSDKDPSHATVAVDWERAYDRVTGFMKRQNLEAAIPPKQSFKKRFQATPVLQRVVERIDSLEERIAQVMETRTKLQDLIARLFTGGKRVVFGDTKVEVFTDADLEIGLQSLSSGEKHILRILFEVLGAEESTLIIDEPEISLHIDWQRDLIAAIRELNPTLQLIVATHSPEIMANVDDSKIFRLPE